VGATIATIPARRHEWSDGSAILDGVSTSPLNLLGHDG
jgi:hypothetical protein